MIFNKPDKKVVALKYKVYGNSFILMTFIDMLAVAYFIIGLVGAIMSGLYNIPDMLIVVAVSTAVGFMLLIMSYLMSIHKHTSYLIKKAEGIA